MVDGCVVEVAVSARLVRVQLDDPRRLLRSRESFQNVCRACGRLIATDDLIWPMPATEASKGKNARTWVHIACAADALGEPLVPPPCKHYTRTGFCIFRDSCFFAHPADVTPKDGPEPFSEEGSREQGKVRSALRAKEEPGSKSRYRCRNRVRNRHRAATIRRWLVATYGHERLASGSGVLEVAGGKGEISFQMVKVNGIPSTNVDPRPGDLSKFRRAWECGFYTRNRMHDAVDARATTGSACSAESEPRLIRAFFEMDNLRRRPPKARAPKRAPADDAEPAFNVGAGGADTDDEAGGAPRAVPRFALSAVAWAEQAERARQTRWTKKGLECVAVPGEAIGASVAAAGECADGCRECGGCEDGHGAGGDDDDDDDGDGAADRPTPVTSLEEAEEILRGVSIVVSMHGDAAVDHALEFALSRGVPFALVPCCVYRELSPWREDVHTYDDLLNHLEARARRAGVTVARTTLNFEGKNQAIYCVSAS